MDVRTIHVPTDFETPTLLEADTVDWNQAAGALWEVMALDEIQRTQHCLVSEVWCRVAAPGRPDLWRVYQVKAQTRATALARVAECIARNGAIVTIFDVTRPPTPEQLAYLDKVNNRLRARREVKGRATWPPTREDTDVAYTKRQPASECVQSNS